MKFLIMFCFFCMGSLSAHEQQKIVPAQAKPCMCPDCHCTAASHCGCFDNKPCTCANYHTCQTIKKS